MTAPAAAAFWSSTGDGVRLAVKVQPRARKPGVLGVVESADGPRLRIAVSEPPEDGKANQAVCAVVAALLGVAPGSVQVSAGASSRLKRLFVSGDPETIAARLGLLG
ncbi:MAG TPA: DUF167 domain-containing protein [Rhodopila sp.]|uniref:DUF167 domain-containing protein n=1 Tax=Rhodopila sp. TaxID=2480087 RepID=UPI002BFF1085|nr:DUF167 domain-containing protein [Rhodopila sp.]HVY17544.1 DUF167 domain-containing protein [Rhodopila sp.]